MRSTLLSCLAAFALLLSGAAGARDPATTLGIDDYFRLTRVTELALSPRGDWLAYAVESAASEEGGGGERVYLQRLDGSAPAELPALAGARRLAWIPGTSRLAFLRADQGRTKLFSYDPLGGVLRLERAGADPILSFAYAPDGRTLAFVTRAPPAPGESLYDRFRSGASGILIDPDTTSAHDFLNPAWNAAVRPPPQSLWVADGGEAIQVPVPGEPDGAYFWSPDSRRLSLTFVASGNSDSRLGGDRTSLGIYNLTDGRVVTALATSRAQGGHPAISYSGGEWLPGGARLLVRRVVEADPWVSGSFPDWAFVEPGQRPESIRWRPEELYPRDLRFFVDGSAEILVENTRRGIHSLFRLGPSGLQRSPLVAGLDGSTHHFSFNGDHSQVAFVRESLAQPPEIYLRRRAGPPVRISRLNDGIAARIHYRVREVRWSGRDGVELAGWLLEPAEGSGPRPLVAHVHGGPAFPFPNAFAPYFDFWPYPLEVYPGRGFAVFLPNYRGTHSYGRQVASDDGRKAADDIIAGIERLVASGVADPDRLAISGHSHGAVLGPLAMARSRIFRAASFAEGVASSVVMYELMSGEANREIHDRILGASYYDDPGRYLGDSPNLLFRGVSTPTLFEGGAYTGALFMLGYPKAARHFGVPAEFIVYPQTGHNITLPHLQREAARRNLDWLEFWLAGREDSDPAGADQFSRWRRMTRR